MIKLDLGRIPEVKKNENEIHRDFELDVLERLQKYGATYHGCPIVEVQSKEDGSIAMIFSGKRVLIEGLPPMPWTGGVRMKLPLIKDKKAFGDPEAVAQIGMQVLAHTGHKTH